ncbi:hypothetical protein HID58_093592 [Brassica napus]|uniref:Uncharacterized protein n=1 Tax=Brassica napus TaxID=3708 RepID=A0ABQ7XD82_BRANA|nr:hypothetical protein HID58_093592 [Brassica napus]
MVWPKSYYVSSLSMLGLRRTTVLALPEASPLLAFSPLKDFPTITLRPIVGINNLNGKALYILNVVASVGLGSWMFLLSLSQILLRGNTLDQHNQSLLPHFHKISFHIERERMIAHISNPSKHKIIIIAKLIAFLRLQKSTSWCNDNPLRREEEDKEDNAEDEEAVMKARAVDDWKDYNPCGAFTRQRIY